MALDSAGPTYCNTRAEEGQPGRRDRCLAQPSGLGLADAATTSLDTVDLDGWLAVARTDARGDGRTRSGRRSTLAAYRAAGTAGLSLAWPCSLRDIAGGVTASLVV